MRALTIGYITVDDPADRQAWSGSIVHLAEALKAQGHHLVALGPLKPRSLLFFLKAFNWITLRLSGRRFHYRDSSILSKAYARMLQRRLVGVKVDLLLAPAGLSAIAHLRTQVPVVHFNDRCLAGAVGYHAILKDLTNCSLRDSLALERMALQRADLTVYASDWAADAARKVMPEAAHRIHTVPMGANLGEVDPPVHREFPAGAIKLLFVGVKWEDKGGPIAVETLRELGRRGLHAELVVCGCAVPDAIQDGNIIREGFLDKSDPAQLKKLNDHFRSADLFILPTRFEAYGIAFCEAAAYGIPSLGSRTGGVPTIVEDGVTGFLLDLRVDGKAYADRIEQFVRDPGSWQRMRIAARKRYEEHFTWQAFVQRLLAEVADAGLIKTER